LFGDDVLLFGHGSVREAQMYKEHLELYCKATSMEVNQLKSSISFNGLGDEVIERIQHLLHFRFVQLQDGLKYLGFILKPCGYSIKDWRWLLGKIERRIHFWCHRWLSRDSRLTFGKINFRSNPCLLDVLLAHIPKGVLDKI
jgi:hypothetical protein